MLVHKHRTLPDSLRQRFRNMPEDYGEPDDADDDPEKLRRKSGSSRRETVSSVPRWKGETMQKFPRRLFRDMAEVHGELNDADDDLEKPVRKSGGSSLEMMSLVPRW